MHSAFNLYTASSLLFSWNPLIARPKANLSDYRPISNRFTMSKVIERIVNHLTRNQLFSPFQSAYCKFHSTKTVLFSLHGYLINAIGHHQQVSCRCLLDLSAAFDTLTLWLSWIAYLYRLEFKSYFSDRLFCVKCWRDLSEPYQSCYVVPQSPLLRPLLFTLCTTPLSSLISSLSLNHHLYADLTYTCCVTSRTLLLPPPGIHPSSQWVMMGGRRRQW